jgi:hypothetical protein
MNLKTQAVTVSLATVLAGCASGGGGSGGSAPVPASPRSQPAASSEASPCGTVNGRPVQCVPTQRAAIDAAMNQASQGSMPYADVYEALGMFAPAGAPRRPTSESKPVPTPRPGSGADSAGLGFQYVSFGAWNSGPTQFSSSGIGASFAGQPAPASAVPSTGSARFTGNLIGIYSSPSGSHATARANVVLDANFSSRAFGFASSNTTLSGSAAPRLDLTGTLNYTPGSMYSGTLRSAGGTLSGSTSGGFYGPRAEEAGGTFMLNSGGAEKFTGAYGAKR